jgi:hypothetical protein
MPTAKIPFRVVGTFVPFVFVLWKDIRAIKYEHEFGVISVKQFFTDEEYQKVDRSKKAGTIASTDPPMLHSKPLPISKKKCDDLMTFLDFIDPTFHSFYKNLSSDDWCNVIMFYAIRFLCMLCQTIITQLVTWAINHSI